MSGGFGETGCKAHRTFDPRILLTSVVIDSEKCLEGDTRFRAEEMSGGFGEIGCNQI